MKQEMDNEKMHGGENITYIPFSRSILVKMDQHRRKGTKENVSKFMYIRPKKLTQKLISPI
jgi:hypothetical protein